MGVFSFNNELFAMPLPINFQFSQSSLQDYVDCPRRFQLKYIHQIAWPALESKPAIENEQYLLQGAAFHRLVQQYFLGISITRLSNLAGHDQNLSQWWEHFLKDADNLVDRKTTETFPEITFSAPVDDYRMIGKFDLLAISDNQFTIFDWKTSRSNRQPRREWVASSLQTKVYPYLLAKSGSHLNDGKPIHSVDILMVYWYTNSPSNSHIFDYSDQELRKDHLHIKHLISEINTLTEAPAQKTTNENHCRFCVYRSHCNRGIEPGSYEENDPIDQDENLRINLDLEQIAEIEF